MTRAATSNVPQGFDFTHHMRLLCAHMVARLPELLHVDLTRVALSFVQARNPHGHGLQATLTPMRFESGALTTSRRGRQYAVERLYDPSGHEMLYILSFYLPRFLNQPLEEKVATTLHELWHISPEFDGDLRRFPGRCYAHGPSQKHFDSAVSRLADAWWATRPPESLFGFLRCDFRKLERRHGNVYGMKIPTPKLLSVD